MDTVILEVDVTKIGKLTAVSGRDDILDELQLDLDRDSQDAKNLSRAAKQLQCSDIPVAFPTETVYGLGADATRSEAVRGIYKAKQRPADNPLIVHFSSLEQLRSLLQLPPHSRTELTSSRTQFPNDDPIPAVYKALISRFWPGPLTIILPNPGNSTLAPEVTAGLSTFGARIPRHALALALIQIAGVPVAAPSANASTKPSPTAAEHVALDLNGRIETIIDGGPCDVGVESTVVDGLSQPPLILRPGGISLEQICACPGWESTQIGYKNVSEEGSKPKAPGMKYRHYSPKARVILYEFGKPPPSLKQFSEYATFTSRIGIVRTRSWNFSNDGSVLLSTNGSTGRVISNDQTPTPTTGFSGMLQRLESTSKAKASSATHSIFYNGIQFQVFDIQLGPKISDIARGIFSSLRELDGKNVDAICVEGIDDDEGDTAAAIMNRLRKAAEIRMET